jgi:hypothetical protein
MVHLSPTRTAPDVQPRRLARGGAARMKERRRRAAQARFVRQPAPRIIGDRL